MPLSAQGVLLNLSQMDQSVPLFPDHYMAAVVQPGFEQAQPLHHCAPTANLGTGARAGIALPRHKQFNRGRGARLTVLKSSQTNGANRLIAVVKATPEQSEHPITFYERLA